MAFASTKSQNQFIPAVKAVSKSLSVYGHQPIELVFTDNPRSDKGGLEEAIPSLRADVVPIPERNLEVLQLKPENSITTLSSTYQVNTRFSTIMDTLQDGQTVFAAVDMEWAVDRVNGIQGRVALISVTFGDDIFLIPVCCSCLLLCLI
jgi:hypothetical protein